MFLSLLFLPLGGFLATILFSRYVTKNFILYLNISSLLLAIIIALRLLLDVLIYNSPALVDLGD
jgi:hypothetical protein